MNTPETEPRESCCAERSEASRETSEASERRELERRIQSSPELAARILASVVTALPPFARPWNDEQERVTFTASGIEKKVVQVPPLHKREPVETSDAFAPIDRYRVTGGWLYHCITRDMTQNGTPAVALCFVPDAPA